MNLLFVCAKNRLRSPTAEAVFSEDPGIAAIGAGINPDSATPLSGDLIEWADILFVMENTHRTRVTKKFGPLLKTKRLIVLDIPDTFEAMDPELVRLLRARVGKFLG